MENVIRSRPKRSLMRRLFAPVTALALLSGGGWGAYQFYDPEQIGEVHAIAAHSAPFAKDELKMLFASEDAPATPTKTAYAMATLAPKKAPAKTDRYAMATLAPPELPPLVEEKTPVRQASSLGGRYGTVHVAATESSSPKEKGSPTTKGPAATEDLATEDPATEDIARGQEPNTNPLRAASSPVAPSDLDARDAFGAALSQTPQTSTSNPFAPTLSATTPSNDLADALKQARPLQPTTATPRYRPGSPLPSSRPATAPVQRPAPPFDIQKTPQQQPLPAFGASPLGAPPVALQTGRVPAKPPQLTSQQTPPPQMANLGNLSQGLTPTPGLANHPGTGRPGESLLEGVQSPSVMIQKLAPEEIQVGMRCTFAIRVQNNSQRTAQNVQIRDEIPLGTELVGTAPRATVSGSEIVWDLGTLSPGEERTVEMELLPREEGELGSVARVTLSAQASAKSRCTRPELALRLTSKPQVHLGQQHLVQIEISNPGSGKATGVMLLETIPTGVSHEAGPALEFEVGTLQPGENRRMELVLTAEQAGKINNVMTARADANLQVEASCEFEVIAPELQLSVEGPQRRFLERPATYRVTVDNPGTAAAQDVQLVTHLPQGMQFVSANNMGEYDSATHSVHWSLAELPASERGTVELVALPIESGTQTLQISTKARQGLEDRTDKQVLVVGLSALMFEVIDVEGLIEIGGETTYEIRVQNQGSKAATNVQIVAIMPPGIRATSGQGETRHAIQGERVIFAPLPQLAPKAETTFRIQAQGVRPGDQRVRVQISSDDLQQPITKEVSTRVYADE